MKKFYVNRLRNNKNGGIDVYIDETSVNNTYRISNVHPNIIRCAIGENDTEYLLKNSGESFCCVTENDIKDFKRYKAS